MTITAFAKKLGIPRPTASRFAIQGMPTDDIEGAKAWIAAHKPNRDNKPTPTIEIYPAKEIIGDDSNARFERLKASEKYLSGQIASLQEDVIPGFITKLASAAGQEKTTLEKTLFRSNQHLLSLRKEYRAVVKQITDIEFKRANLNRGMVAVGDVHDAMTRCLMPAFTYCRNLSFGVTDEPERAKLEAISLGFITAFRGGLKQLITELHGPETFDNPITWPL